MIGDKYPNAAAFIVPGIFMTFTMARGVSSTTQVGTPNLPTRR